MGKKWQFLSLLWTSELLLSLSVNMSLTNNGSQVSLGGSNDFTGYKLGTATRWSVCSLGHVKCLSKSLSERVWGPNKCLVNGWVRHWGSRDNAYSSFEEKTFFFTMSLPLFFYVPMHVYNTFWSHTFLHLLLFSLTSTNSSPSLYLHATCMSSGFVLLLTCDPLCLAGAAWMGMGVALSTGVWLTHQWLHHWWQWLCLPSNLRLPITP